MSVSTQEVCRKFQNPANDGIKSYPVANCSTCNLLNAKFESLELLYGHAILAMESTGETTTPNEYRRLRRIADEKRIDSEMARLQLTMHRRIHAKG